MVESRMVALLEASVNAQVIKHPGGMGFFWAGS